MENGGKPAGNSSDAVDEVDGVTASCFRRQNGESDGVTEYQKRFKEEVIDTKNSKYSEYYSLDYPKKGFLLILAHSKFTVADCGKRNAEKDVEYLKETFSTFGFEIRVCRDQTLKELKEIIKEVSSKNFNDYATLAVAVSSHGKHNDQIAAKNEIYVAHDVLYEPFKRNKTLYGKPKMFFLGTCRGYKVDEGATLIGPVETDSGALEEYTIPLEADILRVYATVQDHVAYHNLKKGSHFFRYLTKVLNEYPRHDLITILTIANNQIAVEFSASSSDDEWDNNKQCLCIMSTLTRKVRFMD